MLFRYSFCCVSFPFQHPSILIPFSITKILTRCLLLLSLRRWSREISSIFLFSADSLLLECAKFFLMLMPLAHHQLPAQHQRHRHQPTQKPTKSLYRFVFVFIFLFFSFAFWIYRYFLFHWPKRILCKQIKAKKRKKKSSFNSFALSLFALLLCQTPEGKRRRTKIPELR